MADKPVKDYDKFMLRFPDGMRDAVAERAKANGRSMNAEIIQIIEDAINAELSGFPAGDARELRKVIKMQSEMIDQQGANLVGIAEMFTKSINQVAKMIDENKKPE